MLEGLVLIPALAIGILVALIEIYFVHSDEVGLHWFSHALHTIPFSVVFTFLSINTTWALGLVHLHENFWVVLGVRILIGIVAMVKIRAAAALISGAKSIGESGMHTLLIGLIIIGSGYLWEYVLAGLLSGILG